MSGRLIAPEKHPDARPVRVGETWRRLFDKIVLRVTRLEPNSTCQYEQICAGLKSGIDGIVHGAQYIWDTKSTMEDWEFLLMN